MPTALVTGTSTGIGQATALRLARAGWTVLAGVRDSAAGERLVEQLADGRRPEDPHPSGGRIEPLMLDVTDDRQIAQAAERVGELTGGAAGNEAGSAVGGLDALVNNAGLGISGPLELISMQDIRRHLEVNLLGQVALTKAMLPALRAADGRIVFLSSVGGRVAMAFTGPYAAAKHGLEAIGDVLRVELHSSGIQVALVEPGSVATPIWGKSLDAERQLVVPPELTKQYGHVPAAMAKNIRNTEKRGISPEQVAQTIQTALAARRMKPRYVVGRDARAMIAVRRLLPDRLFDRLSKLAMGA
ncbi:MAG TPA: SDR family NAD(P)-dependent oxidoreductase [Solirubrobacteraceae bacterium]|jgi:NAD(P)-dependent dehydrogenase (short-subunit alcohol dehydrogenase family)|nr:SDR family NAD(P)-dependent oxidoreductase [Solirubrobacteraceae bacterium]